MNRRHKVCDDCQANPDHVRTFPHTYTINQFGQAFGTTPATQWDRGTIVRDTQPVFSLKPPIPMYDPTITAAPELDRRPH